MENINDMEVVKEDNINKHFEKSASEEEKCDIKKIEVDNNENDACIFPLIFNNKKVQIVSDADSQGNKYFSQVEALTSVLESIYPFLKFDAGSPPTFYSFKELETILPFNDINNNNLINLMFLLKKTVLMRTLFLPSLLIKKS